MSPRTKKFVDVGRNLERVREESGLTKTELSEHVPEHQTTYGRWEEEGRVPQERIEILAEALEVQVDELISTDEQPSKSAHKDPSELPDKYVTSVDALDRWQRQVMSSELHGDMKLLLQAIPSFLDRDSWVVSVTKEALAERSNFDQEWVEELWPEMIETDFVERIGPAEWVLRLTFPEKSRT